MPSSSSFVRSSSFASFFRFLPCGKLFLTTKGTKGDTTEGRKTGSFGFPRLPPIEGLFDQKSEKNNFKRADTLKSFRHKKYDGRIVYHSYQKKEGLPVPSIFAQKSFEIAAIKRLNLNSTFKTRPQKTRLFALRKQGRETLLSQFRPPILLIAYVENHCQIPSYFAN